MASTTPNTILLKGNPVGIEALAGGTITPGHLVALASTGKVAVHGTAGVRTPAYIAREHEHDGGGISDTYLADETVLFWQALPGDEFYMLVPASAAAIVIGDMLESNGDGTLRKVAAAALTAMFQALQAVDNSGGGSAARIKVRRI